MLVPVWKKLLKGNRCCVGKIVYEEVNNPPRRYSCGPLVICTNNSAGTVDGLSTAISDSYFGRGNLTLPLYTMEKSFAESIKDLKVSDLPATKKVVTISSADTLEQGFQKLSDNGILSAPVYNEETKQHTGFLDMRDLVSSVVFIAENATGPTTKTLADLFVNAKWVGGAFTVTYLSRRNAFKPVKTTDPLSAIVELLSKKGPGKVKRCPVLDENGEVVNIVSQSTLVAFLAKQMAEHHTLVGKTVKELELGSAPIIAIKDTVPAIGAFKMMDTKQITGLAIVDANDRLVGNVSSRDLKVFVKNIDFDQLLQPVGEFVKHLRQLAVDIKSPTINVFEDATFENVVAKLAATKVHRLFCVDNEDTFRPIRVISLVDVLNAVQKA